MDQLGQNGNVFLTVNRIGMVFKFLLSSLEKSQIPVCDFSASLQIGLGCLFAEAAGAGLAPQVRGDPAAFGRKNSELAPSKGLR